MATLVNANYISLWFTAKVCKRVISSALYVIGVFSIWQQKKKQVKVQVPQLTEFREPFFLGTNPLKNDPFSSLKKIARVLFFYGIVTNIHV